MQYITSCLIFFVALEHLYILVLEMFLWERPRTLKIFGIAKEEGPILKVLAANQGLYNGFLSAGLLWGLFHTNHEFGQQLQMFFLMCVISAAMYGGCTVKRSIWLVQGLPALLAIIALVTLS